MDEDNLITFPEPDEFGRLVPESMTNKKALVLYWQMIPLILNGLQFSMNYPLEGQVRSWVEFSTSTLRSIDFLMTALRPHKLPLQKKAYKSLLRVWETFFVREHVGIRGDQRMAFQKLNQLLLMARAGEIDSKMIEYGIPYEAIKFDDMGDVREDKLEQTELTVEVAGSYLHIEYFKDNWKSVLSNCQQDLLDCLACIREQIENSADGTVPKNITDVSIPSFDKCYPAFNYVQTYKVWQVLQSRNSPLSQEDIVAILQEDEKGMSKSTVNRAIRELREHGMLEDFPKTNRLRNEWRISIDEIS